MGRIVTFYSYKGGVGRSMALANVAVLLARRGMRVLAIDWDLEAPGLDRYFASLKLEPNGNGLLPLIMNASKNKEVNYKHFLWKVIDDTSNDVEFAFLPSGRESDSDYAVNLERFDWRLFFKENGGGDFIENLRIELRNDFDIILVDSRTGLTDAGGICTIQLPDIVVPMFTANYQSLFGVRDVMRLAQEARQSLAYDRMPLTIFPLPSRFGVSSEFHESQEWVERFEEALEEFYSDWLPSWARPISVLERVKIPQIDFFGFGEKLAVIEQTTNDPQGMGFVYNLVAELLENDFTDIDDWLGIEAKKEAERNKKTRRKFISSGVKKSPSWPSNDYEFDLYISYAHSPMLATWVRELLQLLSPWVEEETGSPLRVFFDITEIQLGDEWKVHAVDALSVSKLLIAVTTKWYFKSARCRAELLAMHQRALNTGANLILPLRLYPITNDDILRQIHGVDFTDYQFVGKGFRDSSKYLKFQKKVQELAIDISRLLSQVPKFSKSWPSLTG